MGEIVGIDFQNRHRINTIHSVVVAEQANLDYDRNIGTIAAILGETATLLGPKKPVMKFIDTADPDSDHPDGEVHVLRGDPEKPIVVVSSLTSDFFYRNGQEITQAIESAALYATATGFAAMALSQQRGHAMKSHGYNEIVWQRAGVMEPRVAARYRFAAGIVNNSEHPVVEWPLLPAPNATSLALHVASFADPLDRSGVRDLAAPYFKMA